VRSRPVSRSASALVLAVVWTLLDAFLASSSAQADEGMWTFDNFPSKIVAQEYGFAPSQQWLDHVRAASLRIAGGCSASFASPQGLVMTNRHCVAECVQALSTAQDNFVEIGFIARTAADERPCPDFELDQLTQVRNVTTDVQSAIRGKSGDAANKALHAEDARLQEACGSDPSTRCDVVSLYHGGIYDVYRYKRYNDVRLVFAPEFAIGFFGGDPDNFNFPRYDYDVGLLRAYENGKPVVSPDYLRWSPEGSKAGDLTFVSGNPGGSSRELTISQLAFDRDVLYPFAIPFNAEYRGQLEEFVTLGPEQAREANERLFFTQNSYKALVGRDQALLDPQFWALKVREERRLRAAVAANPKLAAAYGSAWDDITAIQRIRVRLFTRYALYSGFPSSGLIGYAVTLVRAASERTRPNGERLPEYTDQSLVNVRQEIAAPIPVYKDLEELRLAYWFSVFRRELGTDDAFVRKLLGSESPEQLAHRLVTETHLEAPAVRVGLYDGGASAIAASSDPLIRLAVNIDPDLRAVRKEYEADVDAPTRAAADRIANARFAIYGTSIDPDATFTARLSYGTVKGFPNAEGRFVQPYSTIGGLFENATGAPPYALPQSWLSAGTALDKSTPMNFITTNDIIGGNSGSPVLNRNAQIIGLVFDGNIFSLGGEYGYDSRANRTVAVDSRALLEGLRTVYHFDRIVTEIQSAQQ
jgi:hypothetical protein